MSYSVGGSVESGNPPSNLGNHQSLRLPSGSSYEHIGGLRYRSGDLREISLGDRSYIRIFRPSGSEEVHASFFLPSIAPSMHETQSVQVIEDRLLRRLGTIECDSSVRFTNFESGATPQCTVLRVSADDGNHFRLARHERFALAEFVKFYAEKLQPSYEAQGERKGGKIGGSIFTAIAGLVGAYVVLSQPNLENLAVMGVSTAMFGLLGREVGKWVGAGWTNIGAYDTLNDKLLKGHENETHLYRVAEFIRDDLPSKVDSADRLNTLVDGAFQGLTRALSQKGTLIRWRGLSYDAVMARCGMLLGARPVVYLPSSEAPVVSVPDASVVVDPALVARVSVAMSAPATRCPHCHDSFGAGDNCITGLMNGATVQAHADCSGEMIESSGDWKPVSGAYAYESLVDHTSTQDKKKDDRRVKE